MKAALAILASSATFAVFGCNAILVNDPGVLAIADEPGTEGVPVEPVTVEGGGVPTSPLVPPDAGNACPPGQQVCDGVCVSETDPLHGCGSPSCAPCAIAHGTASCQEGTCVVASCSKGYANCNAQPADGCEAKLTDDPANCAACGHACPAGTTCRNKSCRPDHDEH